MKIKITSIFIVEDNKDIREITQISLELEGFKITRTASNGEIAVKMYKSFNPKPDIILIDYRMPKKNGLEVTKEILQVNNNAKIIFISGDLSVKKEALSLGAIYFLEKPLSFEILLNTIKKIKALN